MKFCHISSLLCISLLSFSSLSNTLLSVDLLSFSSLPLFPFPWLRISQLAREPYNYWMPDRHSFDWPKICKFSGVKNAERKRKKPCIILNAHVCALKHTTHSTQRDWTLHTMRTTVLNGKSTLQSTHRYHAHCTPCTSTWTWAEHSAQEERAGQCTQSATAR